MTTEDNRRTRGRRDTDGEFVDEFARDAIAHHEKECGERWRDVRDLMKNMGKWLFSALFAVMVALLGVIGYLLTHPEVTMIHTLGPIR